MRGILGTTHGGRVASGRQHLTAVLRAGLERCHAAVLVIALGHRHLYGCCLAVLLLHLLNVVCDQWVGVELHFQPVSLFQLQILLDQFELLELVLLLLLREVGEDAREVEVGDLRGCARTISSWPLPRPSILALAPLHIIIIQVIDLLEHLIVLRKNGLLLCQCIRALARVHK